MSSSVTLHIDNGCHLELASRLVMALCAQHGHKMATVSGGWRAAEPGRSDGLEIRSRPSEVTVSLAECEQVGLRGDRSLTPGRAVVELGQFDAETVTQDTALFVPGCHLMLFAAFVLDHDEPPFRQREAP